LGPDVPKTTLLTRFLRTGIGEGDDVKISALDVVSDKLKFARPSEDNVTVGKGEFLRCWTYAGDLPDVSIFLQRAKAPLSPKARESRRRRMNRKGRRRGWSP